MSDTTNTPWDRRLAEGMARRSWEAANDPAEKLGRPSFREHMRSRYFRFAVACSVVSLLLLVLGHGPWIGAAAAILYVVSLVLWRLTYRDACAARLPGTTMKENM